ncbi:hypothetical protein N1031_19505 [Herbiconiux moechotypicola]|uniref:DUF3558 domain-containing protein n=1 Tax=Herbiconiux moechotypicola TaxID=637393 RepID=A0ABN3E5P4_9MICO|nr:hypothetical protein [Herbiconiux moechotypicola]MCS5731949.1 hypothetical protein [Herbiconiux moechotypicola]
MSEQGAGGGPKGSRRGRVVVTVVLAALVGVVVVGAIVVAFTGGGLFGGPATAPTGPTAVPTASVTPAEPTPTSAPDETEQPSRVPTSCDEVLPQATAEQILGVPLQSTIPDAETNGPPNPLTFTLERVGGLGCWFSTGEPGDGYATVSVQIVPGVSDEQFEQTVQKDGAYLGPENVEASIGPETYSSCPPSDGTLSFCSYLGRVNGYGVTAWAGADPATLLAAQPLLRDVFVAARDAASNFDPPAPLWQPDGPGVAGAVDCDGLITPSELQSITGDVAGVYRQEGGENTIAPFASSGQVGAYYCRYLTGEQPLPTGVAVLPGGAAYLAEGLTRSDLPSAPAPDYPGDAYLTVIGDGASRVDLALDGAWISVEGPDEWLPAIVATVVERQTAG